MESNWKMLDPGVSRRVWRGRGKAAFGSLCAAAIGVGSGHRELARACGGKGDRQSKIHDYLPQSPSDEKEKPKLIL